MLKGKENARENIPDVNHVDTPWRKKGYLALSDCGKKGAFGFSTIPRAKDGGRIHNDCVKPLANFGEDGFFGSAFGVTVGNAKRRKIIVGSFIEDLGPFAVTHS
jgi:hypothetical protein